MSLDAELTSWITNPSLRASERHR